MPKLTLPRQKQLQKLFKEYQKEVDNPTLKGRDDQKKFAAFCDEILKIKKANLDDTSSQQFSEYVDEVLENKNSTGFSFKFNDLSYFWSNVETILDSIPKKDIKKEDNIKEKQETLDEKENEEKIEENPNQNKDEDNKKEDKNTEELEEETREQPVIKSNVDFTNQKNLDKLFKNIKPHEDGSGFTKLDDKKANIYSPTDNKKVIGRMCQYKTGPNDVSPITVKFLKEKDQNKILFSEFNEKCFTKTVQNMYNTFGPDVNLRLTGQYGENEKEALRIIKEQKQEYLKTHGLGLTSEKLESEKGKKEKQVIKSENKTDENKKEPEKTDNKKSIKKESNENQEENNEKPENSKKFGGT